MKLDSISTAELVNELAGREGVTAKEIGPYEPYKVEGEGPVVILIVED